MTEEKEIVLKPAPGCVVWDVDLHQRLPEDGRVFALPLRKYWLRRLKLNSVLMAKVENRR